MSPYPVPLEPRSHPLYPTPLGHGQAPSRFPCAMLLLLIQLKVKLNDRLQQKIYNTCKEKVSIQTTQPSAAKQLSQAQKQFLLHSWYHRGEGTFRKNKRE